MTAVIDFLVEILERIWRFFGADRLFRAADPYEDRPSPGIVALWAWSKPLLTLFLILYAVALVYRFGFNRGVDMSFPQTVLGVPAAGAPATEGAGAEAQAGGASGCAPSRIVDMQAGLIDLVVNRNDWAPATPQYTIGFFGLVEWEDTPWFDNKASFQIGVLTILRRAGIDLADSLGRVRGTSGADSDLQGASSRLRSNERAWVFNNPFDRQVQTFTTSAAASYRGAIPLYEGYNERLAACEAEFDARNDNLMRFLDRIAADMGAMADRLQKRARALEWSVADKAFVPAGGNNRGWFDFRADNLFHEARGQMFALHALMQAARIDFADSVASSNLDLVWDRMEQHLADGARLNPWIVSNGAEDGILAPDHLSVMGEKMLRARANMVELREILDR